MSDAPEKIWISRQWSIPSKREWSWSISENPRNIDVKEYAYILAPQWVSVEERLPGPHKDVLIYDQYGIGFAARHRDGFFYESREPEPLKSVTHWMPLPEPPAQD